MCTLKNIPITESSYRKHPLQNEQISETLLLLKWFHLKINKNEEQICNLQCSAYMVLL